MVYDIYAMRAFAGKERGRDAVPGEGQGQVLNRRTFTAY